MSGHTVWFEYEDEEAELRDITKDTSISTLRRKLHEGKIFHFPDGVTQTDVEIGRINKSKQFEKFKARDSLREVKFDPDETLHVRVKKRAAPTSTENVNVVSSIPSFNLSILQGSERALKWEFDPYTNTAEWTLTAILLRVETVPFAEGSFRKAYHCVDLGQPPYENKFVVKLNKKAVARELFFEDVKMQMVARRWAAKYNDFNPPKRIDFLMCYVVELVDRTPEVATCGFEPYVEGVYRKFNNNSGYVSHDERNTPQAFSHFTYEHSNKQILIVDIQGVGDSISSDQYTDPQIHTYDGAGFGQGNLGKRGFEKFLNSHKCNAICQYLGLNPINPKSEKNDTGTFPRPELDLDALDDGPLNLSAELADLAGPGGAGGGPGRASPRSNAATPTLAMFGSTPPGAALSHHGNTMSNETSAILKRKSWGDREREREREREEEEQLIQLRRASSKKFWDLSTVKCVETLKGHHDNVRALCVVDTNLFSASADATIKVWDIKTLERTHEMKDHEGGIECLVANDQHLFSASADSTIKVWDVRTKRIIYSLEKHDKPVHAVCLNDRYLFSGSGDKTIKVWDIKSFECMFTLEGHARSIKALCVSGQYLFSGSNDKTIKVWDLKNFRCNYTLRGHTKWITSLCIWGTNLYSGSYDRTIKVWSLKTLECTATLRGHERWIEYMIIADGVLFSASDDNSIKFWDLENLKCVQTLEGHNGTVQSLAFYEAKRILFSGSHDQTIKVWSWETKQPQPQSQSPSPGTGTIEKVQ